MRCFLSSFRRAISAAFSSFDIPAVLVCEGVGVLSCVAGLALPLSEGVGDLARVDTVDNLLVGGGERAVLANLLLG